MIELLVSMTMLAIVGGGMAGLLIRAQRLSRGQVEQSGLQDNVRLGAQFLLAELRGLGYDDSAGVDLVDIATNRIRFRAMRGVGIICNITQTDIRIRQDFALWHPALTVQDSVLVFVEKDVGTGSDDVWIPRPIVAIEPHTTCGSASAVPAIRLTLGGGGFSPEYLVHVGIGAPVRFYEIVEIGSYVVDGRSWLGMRSISSGETSYQPILGPLSEDRGLEFAYLDATGGPVLATGDRHAIRTIEITLRGVTERPVHLAGGGGRTDFVPFELTTRVALRNVSPP